MAQQLKSYNVHRVLDVGCGSGHGVLSMIEELGSDLRVVAIDENPYCLTTARETLRAAKVGDAEVMRRVNTVANHNGFHSAAEPFKEPLPKPIALVEADICSDSYLRSALNQDGPFDAVTVWLSGVHMYRQFNEIVVGAGVNSDTMHRLFVQNSVYELADQVLRLGGVLQVVDRGETPATALLQSDILRSHREQAGPTTLDVRTLAHAPWTPPETRRVPMVLTPGTTGRLPGKDTAMFSVISVKT
ncbi:class I SAM-dependent methyltransferase [Mesorhizobium sp. M0058]